MSLKAKICGLSKLEDVKISIEYGASYCGFILNYPKSHRNINDPTTISYLNSIDKKKSKFVGVLVDPTSNDLKKIENIKFDYFQLHGNENIRKIREIKKKFKVKIIKTIKVKNEKDVNQYLNYLNYVELLLFDSTGFEKSKIFNHNWLKKISKENFKWMLAGKISIDNLEKIAKITKIVDVSGSLETNKIKDKEKIINFLKKVKKINDKN